MSVTEEWRDLPGYEEFYRVSNLGRVWSKRRDRVMPGSKDDQGYLNVSLSRDGTYKTAKVHTLVAVTFLGPRPEFCWGVRHLNDVKTDNAASNLAYGTATENQLDRVRNGIHSGVNKTHCPRGHIYDEQNTYVDKKGGRTCKTCRREAMRLRRHSPRAQQEPRM